MGKRPERLNTIVLSVLLTFLLSACSIFGSNNHTTQGTTAATGDAKQVLDNALHAMQQLKSVHVAMNLMTTTTSTATTVGTTPQSMLYNLKADGDELMPDQAALNLTISQGATGQSTNASEIIAAKKLYLRHPNGQWYVLDTTTFTGAGMTPFAGAQVSHYTNLLALAQKAQLKDNGMESVNGQSLRHITATFGKDALQDILNATGQANSLTAQQQQIMQNVLNTTTVNQSTLDLWIDQNTSYVQRLDMKLNLTMTANGAGATSISDTAIDYSKFNMPVMVAPPTNAVPTTNPNVIFQ